MNEHPSPVHRKPPNALQVELCVYSVRLHHALQHAFFTIADRNYFVNFYWEDCPRLNLDQAIHGWKYYPSLLMTTFAPLLFMAPVNNVRLLHRIFVDDLTSTEMWNIFVAKLNSQLQETTVLVSSPNSRVLLNITGQLPGDCAPERQRRLSSRRVGHRSFASGISQLYVTSGEHGEHHPRFGLPGTYPHRGEECPF